MTRDDDTAYTSSVGFAWEPSKGDVATVWWRACSGLLCVVLACRAERSAVATGPAPSAGAIPVSALGGTYTGDWGAMHLQVEGAAVRGAYARHNGRLVGRVDGEILRGTWCQDPDGEGPASGAFEFRFSRGADQRVLLDGRWNYATTPDRWENDWDLAQSSTPDAALAARVASARCDAATTWTRTPNVAAYWNVADGATWGGLVRIERGLTLEEAQRHAAADPEVTHFFFTTGGSMVLEVGRVDRTFARGDAAYFRGSPWWGAAPGLADGYVRDGAR